MAVTLVAFALCISAIPSTVNAVGYQAIFTEDGINGAQWCVEINTTPYCGLCKTNNIPYCSVYNNIVVDNLSGITSYAVDPVVIGTTTYSCVSLNHGFLPCSGTFSDYFQVSVEYAAPGPSTFNFDLSPATSSSLAVAQGGTSPSSSLSATLTTGTASPITFSASGLPSGVTANFNVNQCTPTCTFTVSFSATPTAIVGTAAVTVIAAGGGASHSTIISLTVSLPSGVLASSVSSVTVNSGTASADHTPTTGVAVHVFGSTANDGTITVITTQSLSSASNGVGTVNLSGVKYYDVRISGLTSGTAKVCINYSGASSTSTMQYWTGTAWTAAANINVNGATVCGSMPVSALTGTNVAVGNTVESKATPTPSPNQPSIFGINPTLFYGVVAGLVLISLLLGGALLFRRRMKN